MARQSSGKRVRLVAMAMLAPLVVSCARPNRAAVEPSEDTPMKASSRDMADAVAPALERYGREAVDLRLWARPHLSRRDRSLVTVAVLIARNQTSEQERYIELALEHGVRASEVSEVITHLAFYAGLGECHGGPAGRAGGVRDARHPPH